MEKNNGNNAIQILRSSENFDPKSKQAENVVLADGQPFYSKGNKKLYIGDGASNLTSLEGTQIGLPITWDSESNSVTVDGSIRTKEITADDSITITAKTLDMDATDQTAYFNTLLCRKQPQTDQEVLRLGDVNFIYSKFPRLYLHQFHLVIKNSDDSLWCDVRFQLLSKNSLESNSKEAFEWFMQTKILDGNTQKELYIPASGVFLGNIHPESRAIVPLNALLLRRQNNESRADLAVIESFNLGVEIINGVYTTGSETQFITKTNKGEFYAKLVEEPLDKRFHQIWISNWSSATDDQLVKDHVYEITHNQFQLY